MIDLVTTAMHNAGPSIVKGLQQKGWALHDNFLGKAVCSLLREEAVGFFQAGDFKISQSTRWDAQSNREVFYDKHNVFSMQLAGGDDYYRGPRLHEYVLAIVKSAVPILSEAFPEADLNDVLASNKLAVCTGAGSAYDKHYDNSGLTDTRKATILYYMNDWRPELGGEFRVYHPASVQPAPAGTPHPGATYTDIAPQADRLLVFWSDRLVHSVQPSEAPRGAVDHRYALTVWLTCNSPASIVTDDAEIRRHFGNAA